MKAEKHGDVWEEVEQALGSVGRLKILRVLLEKRALVELSSIGENLKIENSKGK